ncbi:hypothetical protein [Bacillus velezensis]|uniref:hypothetical protein n=1 Tax=Bacillus velezensis TaxID=492670 RepID=UPI0011A7F398|nr:hypothetical protein [Bacillus velezensis]
MRYTRMRYTLLQVLTEDKISKKGNKGTPIIGYVLKDNFVKTIAVFNKLESYELVGKWGSTNCEPRNRVLENGEINYYLRPTDGRKIRDFLKSDLVIKEIKEMIDDETY